MRHLGLFEGIGGFMLAAEWMGWDHVAWVEWDKKCQLVLKKNFPNVKGYGDIKEFNGSEYRGKVDIITGGFPCQPFSNAGKRKGKDDDRYLWPEMLRVIREIKPSFVVVENVAGLVTMENGKTLDDILSDLENEGYTIESFIIPACAVQAWHRRDRIWIIAYNTDNTNDKQGKVFRGKDTKGSSRNEQKGVFWVSDNINDRFNEVGISKEFSTHTKRNRSQGKLQQDSRSSSRSSKTLSTSQVRRQFGEQLPTPYITRTSDGLPGRMDRIKQLGNAIVPQVAYELFKAIEQL